jgi:phosphoglucosamine mutase
MTLKQARGNVHRVPQTTVNVRVASGAALVAAESVQRVLALAQQQMRGRGRVVLRPSGTEPLVRVTVEGEDAEEIGALASSMADAVKSASGQMAD